MADILVFGVLWLLVSGAAEYGVHLWILAGTYYTVASNTAVMGQNAFNFLLIVLTPIFVFVVLIVVYAMLRFRARSGETGDSLIQSKQNKAFIGIWLAVSVIVNGVFWLHPTASGLQAAFAAELPSQNQNDLVIDVTARQWEWIYSYPQYHITQAVDANGADTLVLPVGRKVKFVLQTFDPFHAYDKNINVIHSFWVPAFGIKEDVIPGEIRDLYLTPTKITSTAVNPMVRVQCAEVCGAGHPYMYTSLSIVSASDFQSWVKAEQKLQ